MKKMEDHIKMMDFRFRKAEEEREEMRRANDEMKWLIEEQRKMIELNNNTKIRSSKKKATVSFPSSKPILVKDSPTFTTTTTTPTFTNINTTSTSTTINTVATSVTNKSSSIKREDRNKINNNTTNTFTKEAKPVKLSNITIFDGTQPYRTWIKQFDLKMKMGGYGDKTKMVTLLDYLSVKINHMLIQKDYTKIDTYGKIILILEDEYGENVLSAGERLKRVLELKQESGESASAYSSRLESAIDEHDISLTNDVYIKRMLMV